MSKSVAAAAAPAPCPVVENCLASKSRVAQVTSKGLPTVPCPVANSPTAGLKSI